MDRLASEEGELTGRLLQAEAAESERQAYLEEFAKNWAEETKLRRDSAKKLNEAVPKTATDTPFVEMEIHPYGDDQAFRDQVAQFRGDRRRLSDDDWTALVGSVLSASGQRSPGHVLLEWVEEVEAGRKPDGYPWGSSHRERFLACFPPSERYGLIGLRVPDRVSVQLRRQDGTVAGDIESGLSIGQKCTAVLAILLAVDTSPVVIDQPEDEIDNEFTYREMVPLIRRVKERRQVILVTHDPNLPVNADAEMIYALEASDGRGRLKQVAGVPAQGSLDQVHVRLAVEEIMEGSEEAFRRRFVKYGF